MSEYPMIAFGERETMRRSDSWQNADQCRSHREAPDRVRPMIWRAPLIVVQPVAVVARNSGPLGRVLRDDRFPSERARVSCGAWQFFRFFSVDQRARRAQRAAAPDSSGFARR